MSEPLLIPPAAAVPAPTRLIYGHDAEAAEAVLELERVAGLGYERRLIVRELIDSGEQARLGDEIRAAVAEVVTGPLSSARDAYLADSPPAVEVARLKGLKATADRDAGLARDAAAAAERAFEQAAARGADCDQAAARLTAAEVVSASVAKRLATLGKLIDQAQQRLRDGLVDAVAAQAEVIRADTLEDYNGLLDALLATAREMAGPLAHLWACRRAVMRPGLVAEYARVPIPEPRPAPPPPWPSDWPSVRPTPEPTPEPPARTF